MVDKQEEIIIDESVIHKQVWYLRYWIFEHPYSWPLIIVFLLITFYTHYPILAGLPAYFTIPYLIKRTYIFSGNGITLIWQRSIFKNSKKHYRQIISSWCDVKEWKINYSHNYIFIATNNKSYLFIFPSGKTDEIRNKINQVQELIEQNCWW